MNITKNYTKIIQDYLKSSNGTITSKYCKKNHIPFVYLHRLTKSGYLKRISRGVYTNKDGAPDSYYKFQHKYSKAIFSGISALFILGVTDEIPTIDEVTVYRGYKFNKKPENTIIKYVSKDYYDMGIIETRTMFNNIVKIYCYEKIVCDLLLRRDEIDSEIFVKAIKSYLKYPKGNEYLLFKLASKLKILDKVKEVVELAYEK